MDRSKLGSIWPRPLMLVHHGNRAATDMAAFVSVGLA